MELDLEDIDTDADEEFVDESGEEVCPECGSHDVADILRGMPVFTEELQRELDEGKVVLGGCVMELGPMPTRHCNRCEYEFGFVGL